MTTPTPVPRRRLASALAGAGLALAALAATYALAARPRGLPPPPPAGEVVLETTLAVGPGAVDRRLLAPAPCRFEIEVTASVPVSVLFGPPAPSTAAGDGGPAPETATAVSDVEGGAIRGSVRVYAAGSVVLRLEPKSPGATGTATVRVRRRAGG